MYTIALLHGVITDYATKYPEVFPLKLAKAMPYAVCFNRFFFKGEFFSGNIDWSELLKDVYQLLGIRGLRTTPYYSQSDGLTVRFNQTLKQMLRQFVSDTHSDMDQWLPCPFFCLYGSSTGFHGLFTIWNALWSMRQEDL